MLKSRARPLRARNTQRESAANHRQHGANPSGSQPTHNLAGPTNPNTPIPHAAKNETGEPIHIASGVLDLRANVARVQAATLAMNELGDQFAERPADRKSEAEIAA